MSESTQPVPARAPRSAADAELDRLIVDEFDGDNQDDIALAFEVSHARVREALEQGRRFARGHKLDLLHRALADESAGQRTADAVEVDPATAAVQAAAVVLQTEILRGVDELRDLLAHPSPVPRLLPNYLDYHHSDEPRPTGAV